GQIQDTSASQCHELRSIRVGGVRTEIRARFQVFHHDGRTVQQSHPVQVLQNVSNGRVTSEHLRTRDLSYGVFNELVTHSRAPTLSLVPECVTSARSDRSSAPTA